MNSRLTVDLRGAMSLINVIAIGLAFMMIAWSGLALTRGHYYGTVGVSLNWFVMGFGIAILLTRFGYVKVLRPPLVYFYVGFFVLMFAHAMGWIVL